MEVLGMFEELMRRALEAEIRKIAPRIIYQRLEHDCHTILTDEDMIRLHIDFALEQGDKETFMKLTNQLKELAVKETNNANLK